jgi:hypothetical protein
MTTMSEAPRFGLRGDRVPERKPFLCYTPAKFSDRLLEKATQAGEINSFTKC